MDSASLTHSNTNYRFGNLCNENYATPKKNKGHHFRRLNLLIQCVTILYGDDDKGKPYINPTENWLERYNECINKKEWPR
jgi:hypothetical protein